MCEIKVKIKRHVTPIINIQGEIWKDIRGFEGLYQVSNKGRIKRLYRQVLDSRGITQTFKESLLTCTINVYGYYQTTLRKDRRKINIKIHRCVAEAFIDNPENKPLVDHIDGNKLNNTADNLRWATNSENILNENTYDIFKENVTKVRKSERIPVYQLDDNYNVIRKFDCADDAAKELKCSAPLIRNACKPNHKHYKAKGYHWSYSPFKIKLE